MKGIFLALPPLAEQVAILAHVTEATRHVGDAIDRAQREISLLREYRTRLIADVVTGKLDVRAVAENLPDGADEPETLDDKEALSDSDEDTNDTDLDTVSEETEA